MRLSSPECHPVPSLTSPPWGSSVNAGRCTPWQQALFLGSDTPSLSRGRASACQAESTASHGRPSPHPKTPQSWNEGGKASGWKMMHVWKRWDPCQGHRPTALPPSALTPCPPLARGPDRRTPAHSCHRCPLRRPAQGPVRGTATPPASGNHLKRGKGTPTPPQGHRGSLSHTTP